MRKVVIAMILMIAVLGGKSVGRVSACVNWCGGSDCAVDPNPDGTCDEWITYCCDEGGGSTTCDAGYYACNGPGVNACCAVGGGGQTFTCHQQPNNCPAGTVGTGTVISSRCATGPHQWCNLGTAELIVGYCNVVYDQEGEVTSAGVVINTYSCAPIGGEAPLCNVAGSNLVTTTETPTYTITSSSNAVSTVIAKSPTGNQDWGAAPYVCTSAGNCSGTTTFPVAGTYWVVCNAYASGNDPKCSGNPFPPLLAGWTDCGAASRMQVTACVTTPATGLSAVGGTTPATMADITWTPGTGAPETTTQYLWVDEDFAEVNAGCPTPGDCEASRALTGSDGSELVSGLTPLTTYHVRVVTYLNDVCSSTADTTYTTPPNVGTIAGNVYVDTDNTCAGSGMIGQTIKLDGVASTTTGLEGAFSIGSLPMGSNYSLGVAIPSGYICSTASACSIYPCDLSNVIVSSAGKKFYLTTARGAWWQTQGAGVYSGGTSGTTVGSDIPTSITDQFLVLPGSGTGETAAAVIRSGGSLLLGTSGTVNSPLWSAQSTYGGKRMNYAFFVKQMGVLLGQANDLGDAMVKPVYDANKDFYFLNPSGTLATLGSAWTVLSGEKYVVMVDGDLRVNQEVIVNPGGFLAFIVNGDITIDPNVTTVQGIYIANHDFVSEAGGGTDVQLRVEGSVVAWNTVLLSRNLGSLAAGNIANPAEKFSYRVDLLTNMPEKMKTFAMQWSEVVAGTFGN